jgi:hypothetical protein
MGVAPDLLRADFAANVLEIAALVVIAWQFRRMAGRPPVLLAALVVATAATVIADGIALANIQPPFDEHAICQSYTNLADAGANLIAVSLIATGWDHARRTRAITKAVIRSQRAPRKA